MLSPVICNTIDSYTFTLECNGVIVVVGYNDSFTVVINPQCFIEDCPLITYAMCGFVDVLDKVVVDICRGYDREKIFSNDAAQHLRNGYFISTNQMKDKIISVAQGVYKKYYDEEKRKGAATIYTSA